MSEEKRPQDLTDEDIRVFEFFDRPETIEDLANPEFQIFADPAVQKEFEKSLADAITGRTVEMPPLTRWGRFMAWLRR